MATRRCFEGCQHVANDRTEPDCGIGQIVTAVGQQGSKRGGPARVQILRKLGKPVPAYDQDVPAEPIGPLRYVQEATLLALLAILRTRLARGLLRLVPLWLLDHSVTKIRGLWRLQTRWRIGRRPTR